MLIPKNEADTFFKLYPSLIGFACRQGKWPGQIYTKDAYDKAKPEERVKARECLLKNVGVIDDYVLKNPDNLLESDLDTIRHWKRFIRGEFFVERNLKSHTVFLSTKGVMRAYGVLGLTTEIVDILPMPLPAFVDAVLLPWKGKIVCDGLISFHGISFGGGIKASLRSDYNKAKSLGIITSLEEAEDTSGRVLPFPLGRQ